MIRSNFFSLPDALCKKKKTFSKGGTFFSKSKKMPRSQIACEELKREGIYKSCNFYILICVKSELVYIAGIFL